MRRLMAGYLIALKLIKIRRDGWHNMEWGGHEGEHRTWCICCSHGVWYNMEWGVFWMWFF